MQFPSTILDVLSHDERLQVLLGDIGVFGFRHVFAKYPKNITNIGILEQATVGVAAGMALAGDIPVVHTIAPFLVERAYEQLKVDFGYQNLGGNFVSVGGSYDYAALGCTHHCPADLSLLMNIPGFELVVPGTAKEFDSLFRARYASLTPTYFRLSERSNHLDLDVNFGSNTVVKIGTSGHLIIAVGPLLERVLKACDGMDVTIVYCTTLNPFDHNTVASLSPTHVSFVVDAYESLGFDILGTFSTCADATFDVVGIPRSFIARYGSFDDIDRYLSLDVVGIRRRLFNVG